MEPELILFDEPTQGLDPVIGALIDELIIDLTKRTKTTSIIVTHLMDSAFHVATRMAMQHRGKIIEQGTPEHMRHSKDPVLPRFLSARRRARSWSAANITCYRPRIRWSEPRCRIPPPALGERAECVTLNKGPHLDQRAVPRCWMTFFAGWRRNRAKRERVYADCTCLLFRARKFCLVKDKPDYRRE